MSPKTPEQLNDELQAGWEHLRSTAITVAELQTAMWGDTAELMAGLATGRLAWGEVYSEYWKFVADEDLKFSLELGGLGIDYARQVAEVTRWHEQRLRDHLRRTARGEHIEADVHRTTDTHETTDIHYGTDGHHHPTTERDGASRPDRQRRRRRRRRGGRGTHHTRDVHPKTTDTPEFRAP
ncbi:hypothetical protein ACFRAR_19910 [Kitasatospora sp. NPDC056651]|uniref:hypothetical protein n=1 Tax=Kitasatospora sp. NPDC056651 TaxID=3345892 RepID=UPI0036760CE7